MPMRDVPMELIVERRIRTGAIAKDATAVFVAGGVSDASLVEGWTLDAYTQAGLVGVRKPVWFADGAATVRRPLHGKVRLGVGIWGGVQPGLQRIDVGPTLTTRLSPDDLALRLDVDWRIRVAGSARPGSGIAVTIAKDF